MNNINSIRQYANHLQKLVRSHILWTKKPSQSQIGKALGYRSQSPARWSRDPMTTCRNMKVSYVIGGTTNHINSYNIFTYIHHSCWGSLIWGPKKYKWYSCGWYTFMSFEQVTYVDISWRKLSMICVFLDTCAKVNGTFLPIYANDVISQFSHDWNFALPVKSNSPRVRPHFFCLTTDVYWLNANVLLVDSTDQLTLLEAVQRLSSGTPKDKWQAT